jgi:endonuclease/exonuclease/phosphatase family metal-dependent hydrolase
MKNILLTLILLFTLNIFAQSTAISIDAKYEDWNNITTYTDTNETLTGIDFLETEITNDNNYLYIKIKTNVEFSLTSQLISQDITLFIDTDNNENTGYMAQLGFGSELGIKFQERFAHFNAVTNDSIGYNSLGFRSAPTVTSNEYEFAISRNSIPDGINSLFTSNTIKLFWQNGDNNDRLPNTGAFITYTFDETPVTQYTPIDINKSQTDFIRICSYNTLENGIGNDIKRPHFEKIIKAINPDIITFQENSVDYQTLKNYLDTWIPLNNNNGWYVSFNTASRWEITNHWSNFRNINPPVHRQNADLVNLPEPYNTDILIVNAHLTCCYDNAERQEEINGWNNFLIDAKTTGGNIDLPTNTAIIYAGDLNLVGYSQQLTSLITGIDENGNGSSPDWDNSNLKNVKALQTDIPMNYTWRKDNDTIGKYSPGKLDYILFTGSVLNEEKSFVLQTEEMPTYRLALHNLDQNNTSSASDHFPIVADFSISSNLGLLDNNLNKLKIYPNPTNKILNIEIENSTFSNIELFDIYGKLIQTFEINNTTKTINIEHLNLGVYFIQISNNEGNKITQKLIKK